jgi:hypothetical protein
MIYGGISAGLFACLCLCATIFSGAWVSQNTNAASAQPTPRATPTKRPIVSPTSSTAIESTGQPAPTATPNSALATPSAAKKWTVAQVAHAIQNARLEFSSPRPMTNDDYGSVPRVASEATRFFIPSLGGQKEGRIYAFATLKDLQMVQQYYEAAGPAHILIHDNILVQIHSDLSDALDKKYLTALDSLQ